MHNRRRAEAVRAAIVVFFAMVLVGVCCVNEVSGQDQDRFLVKTGAGCEGLIVERLLRDSCGCSLELYYRS